MINYSVSNDFFLTFEGHWGILKTNVNIKDYVQKFINSTLAENDRNEFLKKLDDVVLNPIGYVKMLEDMMISYHQFYGIENGQLVVFYSGYSCDIYSVNYDIISKLSQYNSRRLFLLCIVEKYKNENGSETIRL